MDEKVDKTEGSARTHNPKVLNEEEAADATETATAIAQDPKGQKALEDALQDPEIKKLADLVLQQAMEEPLAEIAYRQTDYDRLARGETPGFTLRNLKALGDEWGRNLKADAVKSDEAGAAEKEHSARQKLGHEDYIGSWHRTGAAEAAPVGKGTAFGALAYAALGAPAWPALVAAVGPIVAGIGLGTAAGAAGAALAVLIQNAITARSTAPPSGKGPKTHYGF